MANDTVKYPAPFAAALKRWPKAAGTVPSTAELNAAGALLPRQFTQKHMALAMYLRAGGATQMQVALANAPIAGKPIGDTQVNLYRGLCDAGKVIDRSKRDGAVKVYALTVGTPKGKGQARVGKVSKAGKVTLAKVTAKGTRKATGTRKAKVTATAKPEAATPEASA